MRLRVLIADDHAPTRAALGYLSKDVDPRRLPHIVKAVTAGEAAYPRRLMAGLLRAVRQADLECLET